MRTCAVSKFRKTLCLQKYLFLCISPERTKLLTSKTDVISYKKNAVKQTKLKDSLGIRLPQIWDVMFCYALFVKNVTSLSPSFFLFLFFFNHRRAKYFFVASNTAKKTSWSRRRMRYGKTLDIVYFPYQRPVLWSRIWELSEVLQG